MPDTFPWAVCGVTESPPRRNHIPALTQVAGGIRIREWLILNALRRCDCLWVVLSACAYFTSVRNVPMSFCHGVPWVIVWKTTVENQAILVFRAPFSVVILERPGFARSGLWPQLKLSRANPFKYMEIIKDPA